MAYVRLADKPEKTCTKCGATKPTTEFYLRAGGKYIFPDCKVCRRAAITKRAKARTPEQRQQQREYDKKYQAVYVPANREKIRAKDLRWRRRNPARVAAKTRKWRESNRHVWQLSSLRNRARKRGHEVTITPEWMSERLSLGVCELTGIPFDTASLGNRCGPLAPSVDRRDSSKGYTPDNCRMILWGLNMALSEWGEGVYEQIARAYLARNTSGN